MMSSTYVDNEIQGNATWDAPEKNGRNFRQRNSSLGGLKPSLSSYAVGSGYSIENLTAAAANKDVSSKMKRNNSSFMNIANKFGLKRPTPAGSASQSPASLRNKTSSMLGLDRINMLSLTSSSSLQKLKLSDDENETTKKNLFSLREFKNSHENGKRLASIPPSSSTASCSESEKSDAKTPQSNSVVGSAPISSECDVENNAGKSESDTSYSDSGLFPTLETFRVNTANALTFLFLIVTAIAVYTGYFETLDFSSDLKQVSLDSHMTQSTIHSMQGKVSGLNSLVGTLMNEAADLGEENDDDHVRSHVGFDHQVQFTRNHINRHIESKAMSYEKSTGELENIIIAMKKRVSLESKRKTKEKYGVGPYQVQLELENAPPESSSIIIELQSLEYMPHSTFTFLEQIFYGLWKEKEMISLSEDTLVVSAGRDIETFENLGLANLSFLENDATRVPDQGTWSICFRNQGNTLYISRASCKGTKFGVIHKGQEAITDIMNKISNGSTAMRIKDVSLLSPPVDANANARYLANKMNNIFSSSSSSHILNSIKSWNIGKFPRISLEPSKSSSRIEMMTANEFYLQKSGTESYVVMVQIEGEDEKAIYLMMNIVGEKTFIEVSSSQDNDKIESDGDENEVPFELAKLSQGEEYRLPEWENGEEDLVIKACPTTSTESDTNASTDRQLMNDAKYQTVLIYVENVGTQPIC